MALVAPKRHRIGRLTPLLELIAHINVSCNLGRDSWIHLLAMPHVANKLQDLWLREGCLPDDFPRELLQSPHCGIPPSIPMTPSLTPYSDVDLDNIRFQSFRHAFKFIQHFRAAEVIRTSFLHWPESTHFNAAVTLPLRMKRKHPLRRVEAYGCTHNARICVQMASLDPNFAIWKLGSIMTSPTVLPQIILDLYDAIKVAFDSFGDKNNVCILKSEGVYLAWVLPAHDNNS